MQKAFVFILLIFLGWCLRKKLSGSAETNGIKAIILNLALPATIFMALLRIDLDANLLWLPFIAIVSNILMIAGSFISIKLLQINKNATKKRTLLMLLPSFAPGLSCFPFLIEYFGDEMLANAAFADVGNKIFVLFILYLWALRMYFQNVKVKEEEVIPLGPKLKGILRTLVTEPINAVLIIALIMLCFGLDFTSIPVFIGDTIGKTGLMMTPLVLLFIGLSLNVSFKEAGGIFQILLLRSGMAFLISAVMLVIFPSGIGMSLLVLTVLFPQSSCSFWPYAHMSSVEKMKVTTPNDSTFDLRYGLNILAFSLPFSTCIIVGICTYQDLFTRPEVSLFMAILMTSSSLFFFLISRIDKMSFNYPFLFKRKTG